MSALDQSRLRWTLDKQSPIDSGETRPFGQAPTNGAVVVFMNPPRESNTPVITFKELYRDYYPKLDNYLSILM